MIFGILWSGYGRDPLGELCLLALTYTQTKNNGIGFIVAMGALQYKLGNEEPKLPVIRAVLEARRNGKNANWLPAEDWEALMEMQLADVRKHLNLKWPETYHGSLKRIAKEGSPDRFSPEIFEKLKKGAYMPIAPDAAFTG